jgi:hypothetical protein
MYKKMHTIIIAYNKDTTKANDKEVITCYFSNLKSLTPMSINILANSPPFISRIGKELF